SGGNGTVSATRPGRSPGLRWLETSTAKRPLSSRIVFKSGVVDRPSWVFWPATRMTRIFSEPFESAAAPAGGKGRGGGAHRAARRVGVCIETAGGVAGAGRVAPDRRGPPRIIAQAGVNATGRAQNGAATAKGWGRPRPLTAAAGPGPGRLLDQLLEGLQDAGAD